MFRLFIFLIIFFISPHLLAADMDSTKKNIVNTSFSINELKFEGDRSINLRIKEKLNSYKLVRKDRNFTVIIKSNSDRTVIAKNLAGDPTDYQITLTVFAEILSKNGKKNSIKIEENFKYNNSTNKFNLKRYEKEILNNLAEISSDKLIFRLSNIQ